MSVRHRCRYIRRQYMVLCLGLRMVVLHRPNLPIGQLWMTMRCFLFGRVLMSFVWMFCLVLCDARRGYSPEPMLTISTMTKIATALETCD